MRKLRPAISTFDGRERDGEHAVNRRDAYGFRNLAATLCRGGALGMKLMLFGLGSGREAELEAEQDRRGRCDASEFHPFSPAPKNTTLIFYF